MSSAGLAAIVQGFLMDPRGGPATAGAMSFASKNFLRACAMHPASTTSPCRQVESETE